MRLKNIPENEQDVLLAGIRYWIKHWDWECPTLFGFELEDFRRIEDGWPASLGAPDLSGEYAAQGALRELLYGASAISRNKVPQVLGIEYDAACSLLDFTTNCLRNVDGYPKD